ncbi:MAG: pyridoxamine 5'-phosphate oxidase family protein [Tissierellia bacterium]|nr:pyridoxamine 5'-phosphate oxidase family protein [Tissierellia bacterium]
MFRKLRRVNQEVSREKCIEILKNEPRGVLSVYGMDGYPYGFPMDYFYDEKVDKIYFHCAKKGHKMDSLKENNKVSFCVYDKGFKKENDWALNITSVIIFGKIEFVDDVNKKIDIARSIGMKYSPSVEYVENDIKKLIDVVQILELSIDYMTGKLVNES